MYQTFDEAMSDPTNSEKDKREWMYNRRTRLDNKVYHGGRLTPDEEAEIERIDLLLKEAGSPSHHEMEEKMAAYLEQRWGNTDAFTRSAPVRSHICPDCKFWQPLGQDEDGPATQWYNTTPIFGRCLSPHLGTNKMVTGRDYGCGWWHAAGRAPVDTAAAPC